MGTGLNLPGYEIKSSPPKQIDAPGDCRGMFEQVRTGLLKPTQVGITGQRTLDPAYDKIGLPDKLLIARYFIDPV